MKNNDEITCYAGKTPKVEKEMTPSFAEINPDHVEMIVDHAEMIIDRAEIMVDHAEMDVDRMGIDFFPVNHGFGTVESDLYECICRFIKVKNKKK